MCIDDHAVKSSRHFSRGCERDNYSSGILALSPSTNQTHCGLLLFPPATPENDTTTSSNPSYYCCSCSSFKKLN